MGLFDTIAQALGIQRSTHIQERRPLALSSSAKAYLNQLEGPSALRLSTSPEDGLYTIQILPDEQGPSAPSPHPKLLLSTIDAERVRGLTLDYLGDHWIATLNLKIKPMETPNPNGRKYETNRILHQGIPAYFKDATSAPILIARLLNHEKIVSVLMHKNVFTIERQPDENWKKIDQFVERVLRHALLHCAPLIQNTADTLPGGELAHRVWAVLEREILPTIHQDGGDLQLIEIDNGIVRVAMKGACASCPASTLTLKSGVEKKLIEAFPNEILSVEAV